MRGGFISGGNGNLATTTRPAGGGGFRTDCWESVKGRQSAEFWGEALGMFVGKHEEHGVRKDFVLSNGVLRNNTIFVFDFNRHGGIGEKRVRLGEDRCHFSGFDAVLIILTDPDLKLAGVDFTACAAAVEEDFMQGADFGDVKRLRDRHAIRQANAEGEMGMFAEKAGQFLECHRCKDLGRGQQLSARLARRCAARFVSDRWVVLSEAEKWASSWRMSFW